MSATFVAEMELPVLQDEPPERADAARNRGKVLAAAGRLFERLGPDCVTMDAIAAEAGVGKGTLFRRFGDRPGLIRALLSEHERRFQDDIIRGAPPLGPGAPPRQRLIAFGERWLDNHARYGDLMFAAEVGDARYRSGPFVFYRLHLTTLLRDADPRLDAEYHADTLLAALAAGTIEYMKRVREMPHERLAAGWAELVDRLVSGR